MATHIILIRGHFRRFKDKHYQIVSFVLMGGKQLRLQRCKMIQSVVLLIKVAFFNHDSERLEYDRIFYKKSSLREITLNTENKSPSQLANEVVLLSFI